MRCQSFRNPLFRRRRLEDDVLIHYVRWYLRLNLSHREMAQIAPETRRLCCPMQDLRRVSGTQRSSQEMVAP